ncbi:hypothetical protein TSUD_333640 [Trifolium subterraneum]|uniref:PAZ domain-containing protein n=1 Tax=Trifolium subterraneum TaxID=3900 RepID=A0A2Z6MPD9_TRISU|nr:hypothetical protein TSUD_333640 [Trifolium subterraneum]
MELTFAAVPSFPITKSETSDRNSCSFSFVRHNKFVQLSFSSTCFRHSNKNPLFKVLSAERDHVQVVEGSCVDEIYDALVRRILPPASVSLNPNYKFFVGLAGPPGAGKSTIAHEVANRINKLWPEKASSFDSQVRPPDVAIVIPMDGFHLYRSELDAMKLKQSNHVLLKLESAPIDRYIVIFCVDMGSQENEDCLIPSPPIIPSDVVPIKIVEQYEHVKKKLPTKVPMARRGLVGSKGTKLPLLTNHFKVNVENTDGYFFQYNVALYYEDGRPVEGKGAGRKILDRVQETYNSELNGKDISYDGEKTVFTIGSLAQNKHEFKVVLEDVASNKNNGNCSPEGNGSPNEADRKRIKKSYRPKRVLDIILRQHAAKPGCLLVRQNFFHNAPKNFTDVGGGVLGCRGLHSSFRTTQSGLSLNIVVATTMIVHPGPVVDFLIANQNVRDPFSLDWNKAKRTLKNLRVTASPSNQEYKITGMSELPCKDQLFTLKKRGGGEDDSEEITVIPCGKVKVEASRTDELSRSTTAISVAAPICYAHLAAFQVGQFMKFEDKSENSSRHGDETWNPKFLVIVSQKNHHTKFFQPEYPDNVPPGTRSTTAISVVAPICYAHLVAFQVGQFMKFEDKSENSSSHGGIHLRIRSGPNLTLQNRLIRIPRKRMPEGEGSVYAPSFDHGVGDPVEDDIFVSLQFVDIDIDKAMWRVLKRHISTGIYHALFCKPRDIAKQRVENNDRLNAELIMKSKKNADIIIKSVDF